MTDLTLYFFCRGKIRIVSEYPDNSYHVILVIGDGQEIGLYLDDHQLWWNLRQALPRIDGYRLHDQGTSYYGASADAVAHDLHAAWLRKQTGIEAPSIETPSEEPVF